MARVDNSKIEKNAVNYIKTIIDKCDTIDEKIKSDDKNILEDGLIDLYSSPSFTKENFIGRIYVQVKGTADKLQRDESGFVKREVSVTDLKKYRDILHGVLFFYVTIDDEQLEANDVFYAQLLPYDIAKILEDVKPQQKYVTIQFKPFPKKADEIKRFLLTFNINKEKQLKADVVTSGFIGEKGELTFSMSALNPSMQVLLGERPSNFLNANAENYFYCNDVHGRLYVIGKLDEIKKFGSYSEHIVRTGNFTHKEEVLFGENVDGQLIEFEGVNIVVGEDKGTLSYSVDGGFRRRYNTIRAVREFARTGELYIDGKKILAIKSGQQNRENAELLSESEKVHKHYVDTLDALGISVDWDPLKMTPAELSSLDTLHQLFVEKKPFRGRKLESPLVHFDIQSARIYTLAREREDGSYQFYDMLSEDNIRLAFGASEEDTTNLDRKLDPVPPMTVLDEEGFRKLVNINPQRFSDQFERFPVTARNQFPLNLKLFEMLSAYDSGEAQQPAALLACAAILARKLYEFDGKSNEAFINVLQTFKRTRELEEDEKAALEEIALDAPEMYIKAEAFALLDNQSMAERCLNRCNEKERIQITEYPISHFFNMKQTAK